MEALTGQEVVSAISTKLRARFTSAEFLEIYKDKPVQSVKTPYIFIHSIESSYTPELRGYGWWDNIIDIRCHPGRMQTDVHTWARKLGPIIASCVSLIIVCGQQVKARSVTWRVEDDVLHVIAPYRYRVTEVVEAQPNMNTLSHGERLKN